MRKADDTVAAGPVGHQGLLHNDRRGGHGREDSAQDSGQKRALRIEGEGQPANTGGRNPWVFRGERGQDQAGPVRDDRVRA